MSAGRCRDCGSPVTWAEKPTGGWHRPLEPNGTGIGVMSGLAYSMVIYKVHECDEAQVLEYAAQKALEDEASREAHEAWEQLIAAAGAIECSLPRGCGAPPGGPCWNFNYLKSGRRVPNKHFHQARLAEAEKTIGEKAP